MISTYVSAGRDIQPIAPVDLEKALWIDVTDPSGDEVRQVADGLNIPLDDIIDSLDPDERPRFEDEEDYYLLMYRVRFLRVRGWGSTSPHQWASSSERTSWSPFTTVTSMSSRISSRGNSRGSLRPPGRYSSQSSAPI